MAEIVTEKDQSESKQSGIDITLNILKRYPNLQELGAVPGDKVVDGELVRVFSDGSLSNPQGIVLTDEMIGRHGNLQELGAKAGDKVVDGELVKTEEFGTMKQAMLGFDESGNDVTNLADWLTAQNPIFGARLFYNGQLLGTSEEVYGEGFNEADVEQRKQMIMDARARDLIEEYGYGEVLDAEQTGARTAGSVGKMLFTPTTLAPVGKTLQAGAAIGAGLGASNVLLEQLAKGEEVDLEQVATTGAIGGVLGGGLAKAGSIFRNMKQDSIARGANAVLDRVENTYKEGVEQGLRGKELRDFIATTTKISDDDVVRATVIADRKLKIKLPGSRIDAEKQIDNIIEDGGASARVRFPALDRLFGNLSTRIRNIDEGVFGRARKYEFNTHTKTAEHLKNTEGFFDGMKKLDSGLKRKVSLALANGEVDEVKRLFSTEAPNMITEYNRVVDTLASIRKDLGNVGYSFTDVANYFPRVVKNLEGLQTSLGKEARGGVLKDSLKTVAISKGKSVSQLTDSERTAVTNQVMRGNKAKLSKGKKPRIVYIPAGVREPGLGATKKRTIEKVSQEQLDNFYYEPQEALYSYINKAVNDVEKRKFFGIGGQAQTGKVKVSEDVTGEIDIDKSIGDFVDRANLGAEDAQELTELLTARFVGGAKTPNSIIQILRDTGYASTIANPTSALVQLGDIAASGALKGFRHTLASLFSTKELSAIDLGITRASQELVDTNKSSRILNSFLKGSGFNKIDQLGKNTVINASIRQARAFAKSPKGIEKLRAKYGKVLGDEFDGFIDDLTAKRMSENVKFYAFNEISDMQPVTLLEMPEAYLNHPDGRVFYMLKSFMLKQYDIVRREVVQDWKKANTISEKAEVAKKAATLAGYLAVGNTGTGMIRDFFLGREVTPEQVPDRAMWSLLGIYGVNKYVTDRYIARGDIKGAASNLLLPATPLIDAAFSTATDVATLDVDDSTLQKIVKPLPVVGPIAYNWLLGGAENYNETMK